MPKGDTAALNICGLSSFIWLGFSEQSQSQNSILIENKKAAERINSTGTEIKQWWNESFRHFALFFFSTLMSQGLTKPGEEIRVQREITGDQSGKTKCPTAAEDWIWHVLYWVTPPCTSAPGRTTRFISRDLHKHPLLPVIWNPEHQSTSVTFLHPEWNNRFQQVAVDPRCFQLLLFRLLLLVRLKRAAVQPRNMKEDRIIYEKAALSVVCSGIPRLATSRVNQPPSSRALWRAAF